MQQAWDVEWFSADERAPEGVYVLAYSKDLGADYFQVVKVVHGKWESDDFGPIVPDFLWTWLPIPPRKD